MESPRLPRFRRVSPSAPIELMERDLHVIRLIHRHRFLRSSQIIELVGGGAQQILRRLQLLYHHGYVERPRAQLDYYHQGGSRQIVYGLGNKGATLLKATPGIHSPQLRSSEKNRSVGRIFLEHALFVSDVIVALELACEKSGTVRLLTEHQIAARFSNGKFRAFRWKVKARGGAKLGVIPDRVFALEFPVQNGALERAYFFLEADRGTMPVIRKNLLQTSFYRKLLAYEATWSQSVHRTKFGFHRFRVLTITKSPSRVNSIIDACAQLETGHGLFLFADKAVLEQPGQIFSPIWKTDRSGEMSSLLD